ncbi:MAG TPA: hypothetical protein QGG47_10380 [Acidobacteriota bacterium]|nr:hypothetical protein [Acidobacteriota bacterium]
MSSLLYGVTATEPGVFFAVGVAGITIALLAAWIPARRATSVSPVRVLR